MPKTESALPSLMDALVPMLHLLPALLGIWFQFSHFFDWIFLVFRQNPVLLLALLVTLGGLLAYLYVAHPAECAAWYQSARCQLLGLPEEGGDPAAREAVEELLRQDTSNLSERIHRWSGPVTVKALLLRKLRQIEKPFGTTGLSQADSSERTWIERVLQVPLGKTTPLPEAPTPELLRHAKEILDRTLLGQTEVKLRILEILSAWLRRPEGPPPVLGLLGPPGVGKTTIAKCISEVLRRPCQSICFGGRKDSAEIKGHSPTYVGSQWGAIVQSLVAAETMDPIIYCDEIDKIGGLGFGAGGAEVYHVLLHATDPTQNTQFQDAYLPGIPIDLSRVVFVMSVNDADTLPKPLLDRIQWVHMDGYDLTEKFDILEQSLWDAVTTELGVAGRFSLKDDGAQLLVETVEKEAGVRKLRQVLETVLRRAALVQDLSEQPQMLQEMCWTESIPSGVWHLDRRWMELLLHWNSAASEKVSSEEVSV